MHRGQVDEGDPVGEIRPDAARNLDRESRLANSAGAEQRDELDIILAQQLAHGRDLTVTPDRRRARQWRDWQPGERRCGRHGGLALRASILSRWTINHVE